MIDHIGIRVSDFNLSKEFYKKILTTIRYTLMMDLSADVTGNVAAAGFGETKPDFWITQYEGNVPANHLAFCVADRKMVDAFYEAGLKAGGKDNGKPGLRPMYHPNYYGAFILDPDGHNIEAVCHHPN